ncbi:MAG: thiamine diphosphokinase [Candidatus Cloacimonetes bacterium]|nr:thiamine diphosphokinase [Candidatus Cloacimonadota bacterium]
MNLEHYLVFFQREDKDMIQISLPDDYTKVIAVDGGLNDALSLGLNVDVFVGDCDSVNVPLESSENVQIYPCEKDFLDGEGALEFLKFQNFEKLTFFSFFQGRWDMTFTHLLSLVHYLEFANKLEIRCSQSSIFYFNKSFQIAGKRDQKFSIIPLANVKNLSIIGAKYSLKSEDIESGRGTCLSNIFDSNLLRVDFSDECPILIEVYKVRE